MRRSPALLALMMGPPLIWAATGGPDGGGVVFVDSDEADGPPHRALDIDAEGEDLGLADGDRVTLDLPFDVSWYGATERSLTVGEDGVALFSGDVDGASAACPPGGTWSGVAAYWDEASGATVRQATLGRRPHRLFVVDWQGLTPGGAGSPGQVQLWLQEARDEAVIVLADLDFGSAAHDGGLGAVVGVQGASGDGLPLSCAGGLSSGTSAWFGPADARPDAAEISLLDADLSWSGAADYDYLGSRVATGDLNGDGLDELLLGAPGSDRVWLSWGGSNPGDGAVSGAAARFTGGSGDELGAAMLIADLDGDGLDDLVLGEPGADAPSSGAGAVYLLSNQAFQGAFTLPGAADGALLGDGASTSQQAGEALAAGDLDGDGYGDLAIGAPGDDRAGTNAGAVLVASGGVTLPTGSLAAAPALLGSGGGDRLGLAVAAGDADGDGLVDLLAGSPQSDAQAVDAGEAHLVLGGARSGVMDVAAEAEATFGGGAALDYLGGALLIADLDADGAGELVMGAARADGGGTNAGAVYVFVDGGAWSGAWTSADADLEVRGSAASQLVGSALAAGDVDGDGLIDLVIGGPGASASAGAAWVFRSLPTRSPVDVDDADHVLTGAYASGASGTALAVAADHDADGYGEVVVGSWFASVGQLTLSGLVQLWGYAPAYVDADGDGLLGAVSDGPDCDDADAASHPGADEDTGLDTGGFADDNDCDGWVDGAYWLRTDEALWEDDLDELLSSTTLATFDFETAGQGGSVEALYSGNDLTLVPSGSVLAYDEVYGSPASGSLAARVAAGSANSLRLDLGADADALGFALLDAEEALSLRARDADGVELLLGGGALEIVAPGDDVPGGRFVGVVFSRPVREVSLEVRGSDGWGLDELRVAWSTYSDRDADGWTGLDGDCDDQDADVNPAAIEDPANGLDDDCDGVVDGGGATAYTDAAGWSAAAGITPELVDFEQLSLNATVTTDYEALGVVVDGTLDVVSEVDGAAAAGTRAGEANARAVTLSFDEVQPAVAFSLLDGQGTFTLVGSARGVQLYSNTISASGNDVDGGVFIGYVYDYGVDTLVITGPALDAWGIDDLQLSALGLDDADGDGFTEREGDCDDDDASANPDAVETWYDGVDTDCDGGSDHDADGDGYDLGLDCDDGDADTNPDAVETWYDGVDADCDGGSDNDADGDGHDAEAYGGGDCDDADPDMSPDAEEVFYDGVDDNCDPTDDDDADGDGYSSEGFPAGRLGSGDCDDEESSTNPDATEVWYDGVDADCGGDSDYDIDGDGYDAEGYGGDDCDDGDNAVYPGAADAWYDGVDADCAGDSDYDADGDGYDADSHGGADCDDGDASVNPSATESDPNDGVDEDCDGLDEWDDDADGHRDAARGGDDCDDGDATVNPSAAEGCYDGVDQDCDGLDDEYDCDADGSVSDQYGGDDCDDSDATVFPGAREYAYDGVDQDCDGIDDYDADGDGHQVSYYGGDDCDDTDASVNPSATERWYDGVDQDCDGWSDFDADLDGHDADIHGGDDCDDSDPAVSPSALDLPYDGVDQNCDGRDAVDQDGDGHAGVEGGGDDCDDADASVNPSATERWYDGVDQDCDGGSDDDADGDGQDAATRGGADCDDSDPSVYDGAPERWYDGRDQDCRGGDDFDRDGDGHRITTWGGDDCDDGDPMVNPSRTEDGCGGGDEDCDGLRDEDCVEDSAADDSAADDSAADDSAADDSAADDSQPGETGEPSRDDSRDPDSGVPLDSGSDRKPLDPGEGCGGCAGGGPSRGGGLGLVLALAWLATRRPGLR